VILSIIHSIVRSIHLVYVVYVRQFDSQHRLTSISKSTLVFEFLFHFFVFDRLSTEFLSGLMRIQTDAFEIIQFILSFIPDELSGGSSFPIKKFSKLIFCIVQIKMKSKLHCVIVVNTFFSNYVTIFIRNFAYEKIIKKFIYLF